MAERVYTTITPKYNTACGSLFVNCCHGEDGKMEMVLARLGKAGGCSSALISAISSLITEALRAGAEPEKLAKCLEGISCYQAGAGVMSCSDAFGKAMLRAIELKKAELPDPE